MTVETIRTTVTDRSRGAYARACPVR
jgi:hypothetical protein